MAGALTLPAGIHEGKSLLPVISMAADSSYFVLTKSLECNKGSGERQENRKRQVYWEFDPKHLSKWDHGTFAG